MSAIERKPKLRISPFAICVFLAAGFAAWLVFVGALFFPPPPPLHAARTQQCRTNLKQLSLALVVYSADNDGLLPNRDRWMDVIATAHPSETFHCPEVIDPTLYGYAFNGTLSEKDLEKLSDPMKMPMIYDSINFGRNASDLNKSLPEPGRHKGKNMVVYADGHTKALSSP